MNCMMNLINRLYALFLEDHEVELSDFLVAEESLIGMEEL